MQLPEPTETIIAPNGAVMTLIGSFVFDPPSQTCACGRGKVTSLINCDDCARALARQTEAFNEGIKMEKHWETQGERRERLTLECEARASYRPPYQVTIEDRINAELFTSQGRFNITKEVDAGIPYVRLTDLESGRTKRFVLCKGIWDSECVPWMGGGRS